MLRKNIVILSAVLLLSSTLNAETGSGSICISPVPKKAANTAALPDFFCDSPKLSVKIDAKEPLAWPMSENQKVEDLDVTATHRIVVLCNGKPQQSFKFRFSEYTTKELCLFINDLYKTVQLWESKKSPWCKCRKS
jgi:hypothetical protein